MADWSLHKHECKAIKRWKDASPQDARSLPPDGVRAIGRLIWARMKHGEQSVWVLNLYSEIVPLLTDISGEK